MGLDEDAGKSGNVVGEWRDICVSESGNIGGELGKFGISGESGNCSIGGESGNGANLNGLESGNGSVGGVSGNGGNFVSVESGNGSIGGVSGNGGNLHGLESGNGGIEGGSGDRAAVFCADLTFFVLEGSVPQLDSAGKREKQL